MSSRRLDGDNRVTLNGPSAGEAPIEYCPHRRHDVQSGNDTEAFKHGALVNLAGLLVATHWLINRCMPKVRAYNSRAKEDSK
jgi:hypothetical protein